MIFCLLVLNPEMQGKCLPAFRNQIDRHIYDTEVQIKLIFIAQ